jgi:hypothetical protein
MATKLTALVLGAALLYPAVILAGGSPHFPTRQECVHPAHGPGQVDAVFGRFREQAPAEATLERATRLGFKNLEVARDACGDVRVVLGGVPSLEVGRELAAEAARVGLHVTLEQPSP